MRKMFFATMIAMVLFASCENENVNVNESLITGETKSVFMKLTQAPGVRAVADAVGKYEVEFSGGYMYFVDEIGNITKRFNIVNTGSSTENDLSISDLKGGHKVTEVPNTSKKVYVVANIPSGVELATAGAYSAVENKVISAASQAGKIEEKAIQGVMLYSDTPGEIKKSDQVPGEWYAEVEPQLIANRIEITDIKANKDQIASFTVEGIYINNFYKEKKIGDDSQSDNLVNYGSIVEDYAHGKGLYTTPGVFHDVTDFIKDSDGQFTVSAGNGKVWGYNLLAGDAMPHIIIELSHIEVIGEVENPPVGGKGYITVTGFTDPKVDEEIVFAKGGQVFTLEAGALVFNLENITPVPEVGSIDAIVTVTLPEWIPVPVKPIF